jgi:hypothetical protein
MLTAAASVMKAAPQGSVRALGSGRVAVALGARVLPDMPHAGAGSCLKGGLFVRGTGSMRRRFAGPKCVLA